MSDNIYYSIVLATPGGRDHIDYTLDEERGLLYAINEFFSIWDRAPQEAKDNIVNLFDCEFEGEPAMSLEEYNHTTGTTTRILTLKDILSDRYSMTRNSKMLEDELKRMCIQEDEE